MCKDKDSLYYGKFLEFPNLCERLYNDEKRFSSLAMVFETENKFYFYDAGTGKVFEILRNVYKVLGSLLKRNSLAELESLGLKEEEVYAAFNELEKGIAQDNIFSAPIMDLDTLYLPDNIKECYEKGVNTILLEVTQRCNLRCKYCIYNEGYEGYRDFGCADMPWECAKAAVDFMIEHSEEEAHLHVGFYGGEPLIKFELITQTSHFNKCLCILKIQ